MKFNCIIFSFNRSAQLDLCLNFLFKNAHNLFDWVYVIYRTTDKNYQKGYDLVDDYHSKDAVDLIKQTNFKKDIENLLTCDFTGFLTDDIYLFKKVFFSQNDLPKLISDDTCCLSLRLGKNITVQNIYGDEQIVLPVVDTTSHPGFRKWFYRNINPFTDFGYPFSVDFHIYRTHLIKQLCNLARFNNPNEFESAGFHHSYIFPHFMISPMESMAVNSPNNKVAIASSTSYSKQYYLSEEYLNQEFLKEKRLSMNMDFSNVYSAHQELELKWQKD